MNESNKYGTDDITEETINHVAEKNGVDVSVAELMVKADKKSGKNNYGTFDVFTPMTPEESETVAKEYILKNMYASTTNKYAGLIPDESLIGDYRDWMTGLKIDTNGTTAEQKKSFNDLQKLTDDKLAYDPETGLVTIVEFRKGKKKSGTDLVRDLVLCKTFTVTIARNLLTQVVDKDGNTSLVPVPTQLTDYNDNGVTVNINDTQIQDKDTYLLLLDEETGNSYYSPMADTPSQIHLGHEMIHAKRLRDGDTEKNKYKAIRVYILPNNEIGFEGQPPEGNAPRVINTRDEFETTGLEYDKRDVNNFYNLSDAKKKELAGELNKQSPNWVKEKTITENSLRREQGLDIRHAYTAFKEDEDEEGKMVEAKNNN